MTRSTCICCVSNIILSRTPSASVCWASRPVHLRRSGTSNSLRCLYRRSADEIRERASSGNRIGIGAIILSSEQKSGVGPGQRTYGHNVVMITPARDNRKRNLLGKFKAPAMAIPPGNRPKLKTAYVSSYYLLYQALIFCQVQKCPNDRTPIHGWWGSDNPGWKMACNLRCGRHFTYEPRQWAGNMSVC